MSAGRVSGWLAGLAPVPAFAASVGLWMPVLAATSAWFGAPASAALFLGLGVAMLASLPIAHARGRALAGHWLAACLVGGICGLAALDGPGLHAPMALGLAPLVAVATAGSTAGMAWAIVAMLAATGLSLAPAGPAELSDAGRAWVQGWLAVAFPVVLTWVAVAWDRTRRAERATQEAALQEATDQAVAASRAKSVFLANMSHELRTPLNAMLGYAELVEEDIGGAQPHVREDLRSIRSAGRHLLSLIDDVLDLSKIEAGRMVLERRKVDLDELVDSVVQTVMPLVKAHGNEISVVKGRLGLSSADALRLRQVLLNLLSNAARFTSEGTIELTAERRRDGSEERLRFEVADTGVGMSQAVQRRVFEEFVQADSSTTRRHGGTGLGLAITRKLVSLMRGEVHLQSEEGHGTVVTVDLPCEPVLERATPTPVPARGSVLVVDDDPWSRDVIGRTLTSAGHEVTLAEDGEQGLELARRLSPRAIVLDARMPRKDGWQVLEALKSDPTTRSIPVVMLTVSRQPERAAALGAAHFLLKPLDREALLKALAELVSVDEPGLALVVEDDADLRRILCRGLAGAGWSVLEAGDGVAALEVLTEHAPDVIVLDLMMPRMDGFEFVERLRQLPDHLSVPVIAVTARPLDSEDRERLSGLVQGMIRKGDLRRDDLLAQIHRVSHTRRARRS